MAMQLREVSTREKIGDAWNLLGRVPARIYIVKWCHAHEVSVEAEVSEVSGVVGSGKPFISATAVDQESG